jgi:hypothetical protein
MIMLNVIYMKWLHISIHREDLNKRNNTKFLQSDTITVIGFLNPAKCFDFDFKLNVGQFTSLGPRVVKLTQFVGTSREPIYGLHRK